MKKATCIYLATLIALIFLFVTGCSKLDNYESSNSEKSSNFISSQQETTSSAQFENTNSNSETNSNVGLSEQESTSFAQAQNTNSNDNTNSNGQQVTNASSQNNKNIEDVQSQLDELENTLKGLDDISEDDLQIPNP